MPKLEMRDADQPEGSNIITDEAVVTARVKRKSQNATIVERWDADEQYRKRVPHAAYARAKGGLAKEIAKDEQAKAKAEARRAAQALKSAEPECYQHPLRPNEAVVKTYPAHLCRAGVGDLPPEIFSVERRRHPRRDC